MFNKPINRWWTVVAGAIGCAAGAGVVAGYVFGVFIKGISEEFAWDRSDTTAGISLFVLASGVGNLVLGFIVARRSVRAACMLFVLLFSLLMMSIAILPPSLALFCLVFCLMGFFGSGATAMPYALAISRQFDHNRGTALALMVSGSAVGAWLLPSFANSILETYGWRAGFAGIGALVGVAGLGGLIFFFRTPVDITPPQSGEPPMAREAVLTSLPFWIIALSILFISIALVGTVANLIPLLTDRGMTPAKAAALLGALGGASFIARMTVGILLDRVHARYIAAGLFLIGTIGILTLLLGRGDAAIYVAVLCLGMGIGAEADLITYMISRYFLAASLGRSLGIIWIFYAWGNSTGIFIGSVCFDLTRSYDLALMLFAALALISGALILRLGTYRFPPRSALIPGPRGEIAEI